MTNSTPTTTRWLRNAASAIALSLLMIPLPGGADIRGDALTHFRPSLEPTDDVTEITLERHKSHFISTDHPVKRVSIGDPDVADVTVISPKEIQLVPKAIGSTNVVLWNRADQVQAVLDVSVTAPHAQLERDIARILGISGVQVDGAGSSVVLRGEVPNALLVEQALDLARAYFSPAKQGDETPEVINLLRVGGHQQVMLEVVVAEMSRALGREIATNFSAAIERNGEPVQILGLLDGLTALNNDDSSSDTLLVTEAINLIGSFQAGTGFYNVFFDILKDRGLGKILAEPSVIARSGETARFLAGGEIPIPVAQGGAFGSITIVFKEFGVAVAFTPTVLADNRIHLQVNPEVSEPDFNIGTVVDGSAVPGFNTRRAKTGVELGDGESFAIAGLLSERMTEAAVQYPILGDIPVLGTLFRSSQYQRNETELVILVTPRLVGPIVAPENRPMLPTDTFVDPNDLEFYLLGWLQGNPERAEPRFPRDAGLIGKTGYRIDTSFQEVQQP